MNELDEIWSQMLEAAIAGSEAAGHGDVAEYLRLKATNDAIRRRSVAWLCDSMIEIVAEADPEFVRFSVERVEPHNFAFRGANMAGSLLRIRQGVRCLTLEAGWTRTPSDGFMRGGALAQARITHFGMPREDRDLMLVRGTDLPEWYEAEKKGTADVFGSADLRRHFAIFTGY
jgi:hypothetical protein